MLIINSTLSAISGINNNSYTYWNWLCTVYFRNKTWCQHRHSLHSLSDHHLPLWQQTMSTSGFHPFLSLQWPSLICLPENVPVPLTDDQSDVTAARLLPHQLRTKPDILHVNLMSSTQGQWLQSAHSVVPFDLQTRRKIAVTMARSRCQSSTHTHNTCRIYSHSQPLMPPTSGIIFANITAQWPALLSQHNCTPRALQGHTVTEYMAKCTTE
jgi:hypothetical protein